MPFVTVWACRYIFSVNLLTPTSSVSGAAASATSVPEQTSGCNAPADRGRFRGGAHTIGERLGLESVFRLNIRLTAPRGYRWEKRSRPNPDRFFSPRFILSNS